MKHGTLLLYNFKSDVSRITNLFSVCTETHTRNPKNNKKKTNKKNKAIQNKNKDKTPKQKLSKTKIAIEKF
jgi:hypothetical protein